MIKFFRQIRQKIIADVFADKAGHRLSKYFIYAIGEIVLVVIGILIALQINNANEKGKLERQEQNYLIALKEEFAYNMEQLVEVIDQNTRNGNAAQEVLKYTGPQLSEISDEAFSKLFLAMVNTEVQYRPSSGVLEEIINSGKLDIFTNQELKKYLSSWSGLIYKIRFQESEMADVRMAIIELGQKHANLRNMFVQTLKSFRDTPPSKFNTSNKVLLQVQEFENETMAFLATSRYANGNYYAELLENIEAILTIIEIEIE